MCRHCDRTEAKRQGPLNAENRRSSARRRSRLREGRRRGSRTDHERLLRFDGESPRRGSCAHERLISLDHQGRGRRSRARQPRCQGQSLLSAGYPETTEGNRRESVKALAVGFLERLLGLRDKRKGCFRYIGYYCGSAVGGPDTCISNRTLEQEENGDEKEQFLTLFTSEFNSKSSSKSRGGILLLYLDFF